MTLNGGVKALLRWVSTIHSCHRDVNIEALQDGELLLHVVFKLKKEPNPPLFTTIEERFKVIAEFVEQHCRFSPSKGTSLSWDNIRNGSNLSVEIAKVLLLLVYHDMMNDRCTLDTLECDVEREIAKLTGSFVMESDGCVYLNTGLDAYLSKRFLPVSREVFEHAGSTSISSTSTISDNDSPVFHRSQKVTFVDIHTVASSSASKSPLQDIMNTPKFQLRKLKRQMFKERDYIDGLEKELTSKIALIAQKESHINQLQYRLDKLKNEQNDQEQVARKQVDELETKNSLLRMRLNEIIKENKDFKSNSLLMERKVTELAEENGVLSSQMRAASSQLSICEAEVVRLMESKALTEEEWRTRTDYLQLELKQATAEKDLLNEEIQILQGKISCLEDEIGKATNEVEGENMGPIMERDQLECDIHRLKNELESTFGRLKTAEANVEAKTQQLADYEEKIAQQKSQMEAVVRSKDQILGNLQKEIDEQREALQKVRSDHKVELEQMEQHQAEQMSELRMHIAASEQELETLKETKREKEYLLIQLENKLKNLETKCQDLTSRLADKDQQINTLKEEVEVFTVERQKNQNEIETKDQLLAQLRSKCSDQQDIFQNKICTLTLQAENLTVSVKRAEEEVGLKQALLAQSQQDNIQQREALQQRILSGEEEARRLTSEIEAKNEQLVVLQNDASKRSADLLEQIRHLETELESLTLSLAKAGERVRSLQELLEKQEQESVLQKELLQQQLTASEESVSSMKEQISTKEEHITLLNEQFSEKSAHLHENIQTLEEKVESLSSSLKDAEERLQSKESLFAKQQSQSTQHIDALQTQVVSSQQEVNRLIAELRATEEQLGLLKKDSATCSELLEQKIEGLDKQLENMNHSLSVAMNQVKAKEDFIVTQQQENTVQMETLTQQNQVLAEEAQLLKEDVQTKSDQIDVLKADNTEQCEALKNDIDSLKNRIQTLQMTEEQARIKELEISQERDKYQSLLGSSTEEVNVLKKCIQSQEEQLATLKAEGSCQADVLQKEISQLKRQLAEVADLLSKAEQQVQTQLATMITQEQESVRQKELLQGQLSASEEEVRRLDAEVRIKEDRIVQLNASNTEHSKLLCQEIQHLKTRVESLDASTRKAEEDVQSRNDLLAQQQKEADRNLEERVQNEELLRKQISSFEQEIVKLKECHDAKENLLLRAEEKLDILQTELVAVKTQAAEKDHNLETFRAEVSTQAHLLQKANEEAHTTANLLAAIQDEASKKTHKLQQEIEHLKGELEGISLKLKEREHQLSESQQESSQLVEQLQLQLVSVSADLKQHKEAQDKTLKQREGDLELQVVLTREKEDLLAKVLQAQNDQRALEKQVEVLVLEKERLLQTKQATERENVASYKLEQMLKQDLELQKLEKLTLVKEMEKNEEKLKDLQEQLSGKSEAVEHYKAQMEKAASHYNDKKQLLIASQEETAELKHSLEVRERELKAMAMENKLLQLDLEKTKSQEENMRSKLAHLEAQVAFADQNLRAQNRISGQGGTSESCYLEVPHAKVQPKRTMSSDSLDQSSLEDSLNNTRSLSAPGESSTPLVRSSERLAAKRHGLQAESLETLYFTPINTRHASRTSAENKTGQDSVFRNPSSSVKRRRTTQVINITLTKKTPGGVEGEESFYSLTSARSQPNLSGAHAGRPLPMELFDTPAKMSGAASDQLIGLPGYRRSTLHSQKNEPDGAPNDWMRIAELQARNKACLPHLKSSYPVEFEPCQKSTFIFTDEEVRNGDPSETIRRASVMPGQLLDSLASHRHSLMPGQSMPAANSRSHRLSLMAGQPPSKSIKSSQLRSPKNTKRSASTLSVHQSSPEKKLKASCFPRPLTPKNKNINSGPSSTQLHPALSPADRRQSMMFTIDNTPKKNNSYLKKGLSKLRSSTRKSPGKTSKRPPTDVLAKENMPAAVGRAGRCGSFKSPQVLSRETRNSPQTVRRSAKSPRLTENARKMMMRRNKM
uniref:nuclear mitotic apparatus protein 1 isoform X2 n=1 Tax=Doryrhamphus excisus TaxID=161450 RepID=UPI0025ADD2AA|nr:nuclear mitotic apparatus protein 1 isoform X2 [Doryrhamphus excisus]